MLNEVKEKQCKGPCGRMLAITSQNFETVYDKDKAYFRNKCKRCRRQGDKKRQLLKARTEDNPPMKRCMGRCGKEYPETPQFFPLDRRWKNREGHLRSQCFACANQMDRQNRRAIQKRKGVAQEGLVGSPQQCGACGTENYGVHGIYKDSIDTNTEDKQYGYLCPKCYWLVHGFQGDFIRMEQVLTYLLKTRQSERKE